MVGPIRVLDLFSGLGGGSEAFLRNGYEVVRIDNDPAFKDVPNTILADVFTYDFSALGHFDVLWMSPPCESFSMQSVSMHWDITYDCRCGGTVSKVGKRRGGDGTFTCKTCDNPRPIKDSAYYEPITERAKVGLQLVERAVQLAHELHPTYWWMENPMALMRKVLASRGHNLSRVMVTYCHYGETRMKPTDLWGYWPDTWKPQPACKNGDPCHVAAPRGSTTGTQGYGSAAKKALVPYVLSEEVMHACEEAFLQRHG